LLFSQAAIRRISLELLFSLESRGGKSSAFLFVRRFTQIFADLH